MHANHFAMPIRNTRNLVSVYNRARLPVACCTCVACAFVLGVLTLLKQQQHSHGGGSDASASFFRLFGQYCVSMFEAMANSATKVLELPAEIVVALAFLKECAHFSRSDRRVIEECMPKFLLDEFLVGANNA